MQIWKDFWDTLVDHALVVDDCTNTKQEEEDEEVKDLWSESSR